jgi:EAL domain-containing protein (putative c-di-GMP-specific phosphodiesterase class I)/ActR/RegA family two-component response regulator
MQYSAGRQILVADHDVHFVRTLLSFLEERGFDILTASTAQGILQKAQNLDIDLILISEQLPDASGFDVCNLLKSNDRTQHIPVILVSEGDCAEKRIKGYNLGADDCIDKGTDKEEVLAHIEAIWRRMNGKLADQRLQRHCEVTQELVKVIDDGQIQTYFQPIYLLRPFRLFGLEVLSRPVGKTFFTSAEELFKAALKHDLYFPLEMLCWNRAAEVISQRTKNERFFFNCNAYVVENDKFPAVKSVFARNQIPFNNIVLEISERSSISQEKMFYGRLGEFRDSGFTLAVDDVGAGYSSLESIVAVKPEIVKIDYRIIHGLDQDEIKRSVVRLIVSFCKENRIISVAEGVETKEEFQAIMSLGIDAVQGYYLYRPSPVLNLREMKDVCIAFA